MKRLLLVLLVFVTVSAYGADASLLYGWWVNDKETQLYHFDKDTQFSYQEKRCLTDPPECTYKTEPIRHGAWEQGDWNCGDLFTYLGSTHCCYRTTILNKTLILHNFSDNKHSCPDQTLFPAPVELTKTGLPIIGQFELPITLMLFSNFAGWDISESGVSIEDKFTFKPCKSSYIRDKEVSQKVLARDRLRNQKGDPYFLHLVDTEKVLFTIEKGYEEDSGWDYQSGIWAKTLKDCKKYEEIQRTMLKQIVYKNEQ